MNDAVFSKGFLFAALSFHKFHYTDNRSGVQHHFFALMLSGHCRITTENAETVEINEGDIFYIPNNCRYQSYWHGNPEVAFISLGFLYLPNFDERTYPVQVIPSCAKAVELFHLLSAQKKLSARDVGLFYTLAGILVPSMQFKSVCRSREIVEHTENFLVEHPFARTSELAKSCAISEASLYSAFQKSSDITLNQLRNKILLEKARDLLITTDKPIEYISDLMQFSSSSYFRKKFKAMFNLTPREMRKKYQI